MMPPQTINGVNQANQVEVHNAIERDIDSMMSKSKPRNFIGEGREVGKQLEEWIEKMDDYFDLARSSKESKVMIAHFKLEKYVKIWWRKHYMENHLQATTWAYIKAQLKKNYQNKTYQLERED